MKSVVINGRFLTQSVTGVQRYATETLRALDCQLASNSALRDRYSFRLITPRHDGPDLQLKHIPRVSVGRLTGHAWEQLELPIHAGRALLLNLCNTAPLISRNVVAIHDASVFAIPEAYSLPFRLWYRSLIPLLGRVALQIVTVSEFSRTELSQRAGIPHGRIAVVPQGCEHITRAPADTRIFSRLPVSPQAYILAVGSQGPHKNLGLLSAALAQMADAALPMVLAGGRNPKIFGSAAVARSHGVHSAGYTTDGELRALYENACCFVYPSLYEGFGIPPLEAMMCGCPVIVSRAASLPEVCGNAALYCNPHDVHDLVQKLQMVTQNPTIRRELRGRGVQRARAFTWDRAAAALVAVLDQVRSA